MAFNNDRLDYIMALLHNNREEEAIAIIMEAKNKDHKCYMRFPNGDGYDAILEWCKHSIHNSQFIFNRI